MTPDEVKAMIRRKAEEAGVDPSHALAMAHIESRFNPKADNGHHRGLYQFGDAEWKTWGKGRDVYDPEANVDAFIGYQGQITDSLKKSLGRDPTGAERYLGWQQGAGGAAKLIANPDAPAASVVGNAAWSQNGGKGPQTASGFVGQWGKGYQDALAAVNGGAPAGGPPVIGVGNGGSGVMQQPDPVMAAAPAAPDPNANIDQEIAQWSSMAPPGNSWGGALAALGKGIGGAGGGLLSGATKTAQPAQAMPMMQAQAHRPEMGAGLLAAAMTPEDMRKRQMMGLLGGMG